MLRKLTEMRDNFNMTDFEKQAMNKLIGDYRIHSKIRFVYDGSFLLNKIFLIHRYPDRSGSYMKILGFEFTPNTNDRYDTAPCIKYGFSIEEIEREEKKLKSFPVVKPLIILHVISNIYSSKNAMMNYIKIVSLNVY